jgi:hypothetical protein
MEYEGSLLCSQGPATGPYLEPYASMEVLTAVVMKSLIIWDVTPCSPLKFNRHFEEEVASNFRVEKYTCLLDPEAGGVMFL